MASLVQTEDDTRHQPMKKNILVVFTGGTIGSKSEAGTINTSADAGFALLQRYRQSHPDIAETVTFSSMQPFGILSENLHPSHWRSMVSAIEALDLASFAGIIVTHGTDTLAFSAAMLALYFNRLPIPLVLVSSDKPLADPRANGLDNFSCAVSYIRDIGTAGVFAAYRNPGGAMHLHLASRLASCLPLGSDFISAQSRPYATYSPDGFEFHHPLSPRSPYELKPDFSKKLLLIRPYPGLNYRDFRLDGCDAVLHDLYHSGTACVSAAVGAEYNLIEFAAACRQRGIPLYLAPALYSDDAYASTLALLSAGAEMVWNISLEAAYAKLILALANFGSPQAISAFLSADVAWEHLS